MPATAPRSENLSLFSSTVKGAAPTPTPRPHVKVETLSPFGRRLQTLMRAILNIVGRPRVGETHHIFMAGHIERREQLWGGAAVLAGTRLPIFVIADAYERKDGKIDAVLEAYPSLTKGDVYFALAYSAIDDGVEADRRAYLRLIPSDLRD